jgi:hypothetical protein
MDNFKGQNILNLVKEFPNDDSCKAYLSKIKWIDVKFHNVIDES